MAVVEWNSSDGRKCIWFRLASLKAFLAYTEQEHYGYVNGAIQTIVFPPVASNNFHARRERTFEVFILNTNYIDGF